MKKVKIVLLLFLPIFSFNLLYQHYDDISFNYPRNSQRNNECTLLGNTNESYLTISGVDKENFSEVYNTLDSLSRDNNLLVNQGYTDGEHKRIYFTNLSNMSTINCMSVSNVKKLPADFNEMDFYSTIELDDPNQMGLIFDPLKNHIIELRGLNSNHSIKNVNYRMSLYYDEYQDVLQFYDALVDVYPEYKFHLAEYEFNPDKYPNENYNFIKSYEFLYCILLVFILSFTYLVDLSYNLKTIGVMKMNGYKTFDLVKTYILKNLFAYIIVNLVISTSLYYFFFNTSKDPTHYFLNNLIISHLVLLMLFTFLEVISFVIVRSYKVIYMIKNFYDNTTLINFNYILKLVLFVFLVIPVSNGVEVINESVRTIGYLNNIKPLVKDHYTFYNVEYGNSALKDDKKTSDAVYEYLSINNSAIYVYYGMYMSDGYIFVNDQFILKNNISGMPGKALSFPSDSDKDYIYIPESKYDSEYGRINEIFETFKETYHEQSYDYEIVKIQDYGKVYSYDHDLFETNGFINNDILVVSVPDSYNKWDVTVHLDPTIEDGNQYLNAIINEYRPEFNARYLKVTDVINERETLFYGLLIKHVPLLLVICLLIILINIQVVIAYITLKEKEIAIMKSSGFSTFDTYKSLILMELSFVSTYGVLAFILSRNIVFMISSMIVLLLIDLLFYVYLYKRKVNYLVLR